MTHDARYPIGRFQHRADTSPESVAGWIERIASQPARLEAAVTDLNDEQLDTPYRNGGWTVRQLVHHVADSHINAYVRIKRGLTENTPTITPYEQDRWASGADYRAPIGDSLALLAHLHRRWVQVLRAVSSTDLARTYIHPEESEPVDIARAIATYAWHGDHHIAHVTALRERMGW